MKKSDCFFLLRGIFCFFLNVSFFYVQGQNGSPCYSPVTGEGKAFSPVSGGVLSGSFVNNGSNLIDGNTTNYAVFGSLAGVLNGSGVSVRDIRPGFLYPGGYAAGYVVEIPAGLLSADVLNGMVVQTWLDGTLQESYNGSGSLLSVQLLGGSSNGRIFISFKTANSKPFDEIRLVSAGVVSVLENLRIYYAMAFDPDCGIAENNTVCDDVIAGSGTSVAIGGGLIQSLNGLANAERVIDGDKSNYALYSPGLIGSSLLGSPYVAVKDESVIYPAGHKAGFVIGSNSSGLISLSLLDGAKIETYLHGIKQDEETLNNSSGIGLLSFSLLGSSANGKQKLGITTTLPFNEVRIVFPSVLDASLSALRIYYAFEESATGCSDCTTALTTAAAQPYTGELVSRDRDPGLFTVYNTTGIYGVTLGTLTNTGNVTNASLTDFAHFSVLAGLFSGGARVTVKRTGGVDYPAGTIAGFAIKSGSSLISTGLLSGITIRLYKDDAQNPVQQFTGASLASGNLLSGSGGITFVGGKSSVAFDEIEIDVNLGLVSAGLPLTYDIYYAYVQLDTDGDGVPDCLDVCASGNDNLDADGDGVPDCNDTCNESNGKSAYIDTDGDGLKNACDPDSDNDGIPDNTEGINTDTDGDGIFNYLDLDSDNDGITDLYESGVNVSSHDADHNGVLDTPNPLSTTTPKDSDGDLIPDYLDLDSDNDSITDLRENGVAGVQDADNDGVVDGTDGDRDGIRDSADTQDNVFGSPGLVSSRDTDGDGIADFRDLDTDNDGITDLKENGLPGVTDADADGVVDGPDADGDGISDSADTNDGVFGSPDLPASKDTDGDNKPDYRDLDSDNDSISDLRESGLTGYADTDNNGEVDGSDSDQDGIMDSVDTNDGVFGSPGQPSPKDTDNDSTPDYNDLDSDGDGMKDIVENGKGGLDSNADGVVDGLVDSNDDDGIADAVDIEPNGFGGLGAIPDLVPSLTVIPSSLAGSSSIPINLRIRVIEINDAPTDGSLITVRLKSGADWIVGLSPGDVVNGWTYTGLSGANHLFTSNMILVNQNSTFNVPATFYMGGTHGQYVFTVSIASGSGGEQRISNNADQETVSYNP